MDQKTFDKLRETAAKLHDAQPKGKGAISMDAIFIALASAQNVTASTAAATPRPGREQPPADWFTETLQKVAGKGEAMTVSRFLMYAGRFPVKRMDQINAVRWLKEAGHVPRKTGGQLVFDL